MCDFRWKLGAPTRGDATKLQRETSMQAGNREKRLRGTREARIHKMIDGGISLVKTFWRFFILVTFVTFLCKFLERFFIKNVRTNVTENDNDRPHRLWLFKTDGQITVIVQEAQKVYNTQERPQDIG